MVKRILGSVLVLTLILAFNVNLLALNSNPGEGDREKTAEKLTKNLSTHLNLSESQTSAIQNILVDYQKQISDLSKAAAEVETEVSKTTSMADLESNVNEQITAILDESQNATFETVKDQWWKEVNESVTEPMKKIE